MSKTTAVRAKSNRAKVASSSGSGMFPLLLVSVGVAIIVGAVVILALTRIRQNETLAGPLIADAPLAPNFTLNDEHGQPVSLASLRGQVVALTFLYTNCPDVCPLIAQKIGSVQASAPNLQSKWTALAVTVDPVHDTAAAAQQFDKAHGVQETNWHYLIGTQASLIPVWKEYYVGTDAAQVANGVALQATPSTIDVNHTAIVYIIDPNGHLRVALDATFATADLQHDIEALAR